jgi:hypothetical protein
MHGKIRASYLAYVKAVLLLYFMGSLGKIYEVSVRVVDIRNYTTCLGKI